MQPDPPAVIVAYQDVTAESGMSLLHPDDDLAVHRELEESFCTNFICCGQYLPDLHALLQHYEDRHVRFEGSSAAVQPDLSDSEAKMKSSGMRKRRMLAVDLEQCDFLVADDSTTTVVSAFDNTVLRTISTSDSVAAVPGSGTLGQLRRSQSVPAPVSRLPNLLATESPLEQYRFIQSILAATVDDQRPTIVDSDQSSSSSSSSLAASVNTAVSSSPAAASVAASPTVPVAKADRPYVCRVPGCSKAYKNPNGLKYHEKHGHDSAQELVERPHRCSVTGCGKKYKNPNGLKYHMAHAHPNFVRHLGAATSRYHLSHLQQQQQQTQSDWTSAPK